jgi:glycosyltransferase involved in cell wall biosynthesis
VSSPPDVSVVVPTRDRAESLASCLAALGGQEFLGTFEVVVVDDGSDDPEAVSRACASTPHTRLIRLEGHGPAAARNRGVASASGRIVAFTDDDCEPAGDWLRRLAAAVDGGACAAAGLTINALEHDVFAEASQSIVTTLMEHSLTRPDIAVFATTNNLAATADALRAIRFDERYRRAGGEDRDWCVRFADAGFSIIYDPSAVVRHRHRGTLPDFCRQHLAYGRGARRFHRTHTWGTRLEHATLYGRMIRNGFRQGVAVGVLVCLAQVVTAVGFVLEGSPPPAVDSPGPGAAPRFRP